MKNLYFEVITDGDQDCVFASEFHKATRKEIAEAQRLHKQGECPHTIFYDIESYPYDLKYCGTCGKFKGRI